MVRMLFATDTYASFDLFSVRTLLMFTLCSNMSSEQHQLQPLFEAIFLKILRLKPLRRGVALTKDDPMSASTRPFGHRLAHLYDALTTGSVAGRAVHLPNIYRNTVIGAIAVQSDNYLTIFGEGFSITYREALTGDYIEDRLLIAWNDGHALTRWIDAVESSYYPPAFTAGNRPLHLPPSDWTSVKVDDEDSQSHMEGWALESACASWGYRTRSAPDDNGSTPRTYYFQSVIDAVYARLMN
jgi:hypothetical protein